MESVKKRIYLDYASATPTSDAVLAAMEPYWQEVFANPQAVHQEGQRAHQAIEQARAEIAETLQVKPAELIFTSGATEANSLALVGLARAAAANQEPPPTVAVSSIAHSSVRDIKTAYGQEVTLELLPVDTFGQIDPERLPEYITADTSLVSLSHANSEIGTKQPTARVKSAITKLAGSASRRPLLHVDASQTGLYYCVAPERLGADLVTINSAKIHGPKGVGLLWVRSGTPLAPLLASSSRRQVSDYQRLRPGTPPTPLIVGLASALSSAQKNYRQNHKQVKDLQTYFIKQLQSTFSDVRLNGHPTARSPHNISLTFRDIDHDYLATRLDAHGVAVATTSACQARHTSGSSILQELREDDTQALRISLGSKTTQDELDKTLKILKDLV